MLNLLPSVGEFERDIMLERQREGIAKADDIKKLDDEGLSSQTRF
jgi:DNA invertase Pin-like site-specific DNA recombinase